jgi:hypothetical protein
MMHLCLWATITLCLATLAAGYVFWAARDVLLDWWDDFMFRRRIHREFDRAWRAE